MLINSSTVLSCLCLYPPPEAVILFCTFQRNPQKAVTLVCPWSDLVILKFQFCKLRILPQHQSSVILDEIMLMLKVSWNQEETHTNMGRTSKPPCIWITNSRPYFYSMTLYHFTPASFTAAYCRQCVSYCISKQWQKDIVFHWLKTQ